MVTAVYELHNNISSSFIVLASPACPANHRAIVCARVSDATVSLPRHSSSRLLCCSSHSLCDCSTSPRLHRHRCSSPGRVCFALQASSSLPTSPCLRDAPPATSNSCKQPPLVFSSLLCALPVTCRRRLCLVTAPCASPA